MWETFLPQAGWGISPPGWVWHFSPGAVELPSDDSPVPNDGILPVAVVGSGCTFVSRRGDYCVTAPALLLQRPPQTRVPR